MTIYKREHHSERDANLIRQSPPLSFNVEVGRVSSTSSFRFLLLQSQNLGILLPNLSTVNVNNGKSKPESSTSHLPCPRRRRAGCSCRLSAPGLLLPRLAPPLF